MGVLELSYYQRHVLCKPDAEMEPIAVEKDEQYLVLMRLWLNVSESDPRDQHPAFCFCPDIFFSHVLLNVLQQI